MKEIKDSDINCHEISLLYNEDVSIEKAILQITNNAVNHVKKGNQVIIITDRGMTKDKNYVPALLATGAIHHRLIKEKIHYYYLKFQNLR